MGHDTQTRVGSTAGLERGGGGCPLRPPAPLGGSRDHPCSPTDGQKWALPLEMASRRGSAGGGLQVGLPGHTFFPLVTPEILSPHLQGVEGLKHGVNVITRAQSVRSPTAPPAGQGAGPGDRLAPHAPTAGSPTPAPPPPASSLPTGLAGKTSLIVKPAAPTLRVPPRS